jgi:hypothetical protein
VTTDPSSGVFTGASEEAARRTVFQTGEAFFFSGTRFSQLCHSPAADFDVAIDVDTDRRQFRFGWSEYEESCCCCVMNPATFFERSTIQKGSHGAK